MFSEFNEKGKEGIDVKIKVQNALVSQLSHYSISDPFREDLIE
jgi:hypothetical protein